MIITVNVAVLLAVIVYLRVRRAVAPRTRADQWVTVALVLSLGLLLYPTDTGRFLSRILGAFLGSLGQALSAVAL
jgi:hypothetical protein